MHPIGCAAKLSDFLSCLALRTTLRVPLTSEFVPWYSTVPQFMVKRTGLCFLVSFIRPYY